MVVGRSVGRDFCSGDGNKWAVRSIRRSRSFVRSFSRWRSELTGWAGGRAGAAWGERGREQGATHVFQSCSQLALRRLRRWQNDALPDRGPDGPKSERASEGGRETEKGPVRPSGRVSTSCPRSQTKNLSRFHRQIAVTANEKPVRAGAEGGSLEVINNTRAPCGRAGAGGRWAKIHAAAAAVNTSGRAKIAPRGIAMPAQKKSPPRATPAFLRCWTLWFSRSSVCGAAAAAAYLFRGVTAVDERRTCVGREGRTECWSRLFLTTSPSAASRADHDGVTCSRLELRVHRRRFLRYHYACKNRRRRRAIFASNAADCKVQRSTSDRRSGELRAALVITSGPGREGIAFGDERAAAKSGPQSSGY